MNLPEREARLAKIEDELDELERLEETIIREAEADWFPILRRADADPDTLLLADASLVLRRRDCRARRSPVVVGQGMA